MNLLSPHSSLFRRQNIEFWVSSKGSAQSANLCLVLRGHVGRERYGVLSVEPGKRGKEGGGLCGVLLPGVAAEDGGI